MKNLKRNIKACFILMAVSLSLLSYGAAAHTQEELNAQLFLAAKAGHTNKVSRL